MPITIHRLSDNHTYEFKDIKPSDLVLSLKRRIRDRFMPKYTHGCRLQFNSQILKSRHRLKHYKIPDNSIIDMNDTQDWSDSSSSDNDNNNTNDHK